MKQSLEDFKTCATACEDESEVDRVAICWLRLLCMDHGKDGDRAYKLLAVVADILDIERL